MYLIHSSLSIISRQSHQHTSVYSHIVFMLHLHEQRTRWIRAHVLTFSLVQLLRVVVRTSFVCFLWVFFALGDFWHDKSECFTLCIHLFDNPMQILLFCWFSLDWLNDFLVVVDFFIYCLLVSCAILSLAWSCPGGDSTFTLTVFARALICVIHTAILFRK